jgi:hypothetical protein
MSGQPQAISAKNRTVLQPPLKIVIPSIDGLTIAHVFHLPEDPMVDCNDGNHGRPCKNNPEDGLPLDLGLQWGNSDLW